MKHISKKNQTNQNSQRSHFPCEICPNSLADATLARAPRFQRKLNLKTVFLTVAATTSIAAAIPAQAAPLWNIHQDPEYITITENGIGDNNLSIPVGTPFSRFDEFEFTTYAYSYDPGELRIAPGSKIIFNQANDRQMIGVDLGGHINLGANSSLTFSNRINSTPGHIGGAIFSESKWLSFMGSLSSSNGGDGDLFFKNNHLRGVDSGGAAWGSEHSSDEIAVNIGYNKDMGRAEVIQNAIIQNNTVQGSGGAFFLKTDSSSNANFHTSNDVIMSENRALNHGGVAYLNSGGDNDLTIGTGQNAIIQNNSAQGNGGAFYLKTVNNSSSNTNIRAGNDVIISDNRAQYHGGAIYLNSGYQSDLSIEANRNAIIQNNTVQGKSGGAFYLNSDISGSGSIRANNDITISGNRAQDHGGAIYLNSAGSNEFQKSSLFIEGRGTVLIENNSTGTAAGKFLDGGNGGAFYVNGFNAKSEISGGKVVIQNNKASMGGAGFVSSPENTEFSLSANTLIVSGNQSAKEGGAFYVHAYMYNLLNVGIYPGNGNGGIFGNKAALQPGASTETGGAFHIESHECMTQVNIDGSVLGMDETSTFVIKGNTVGTGANSIQRAFYVKNGMRFPQGVGEIYINADKGTIELHDEFLAVVVNTVGFTTRIASSYPEGTFAQVGPNARMFVPGSTTVDQSTHRLEDGARYQTYAENAPMGSFGQYHVSDDSTLIAKGAGNVIASEKISFGSDSTITFDFGSGFTPNTTAMLTLEGTTSTLDINPPHTVAPGENKINVSGNAIADGEFYLLDASKLGSNTAVLSSNLPNNFDTTNLTFNGNPVVPQGTLPQAGVRQYGSYSFYASNPSAPDSDSNKLYLKLETQGGNIENSYDIGTTAAWDLKLPVTWKNNSNAQTSGHSWMGKIHDNTPNPPAQVTSFLNGDLVSIVNSSNTLPGFELHITLDGDIHVGSLTIDGYPVKFLGGTLTGNTKNSVFHPSLKGTLEPLLDGTLHILNGTTVEIANTIDFSGTRNQVGIQIADNGTLRVLDNGRLGLSDAQNIAYTGGGSISFVRTTDYTYKGKISATPGSNVTISVTGSGFITFTQNQEFSGSLQVSAPSGTGGIPAVGGGVILDNVTLDVDAVMTEAGTTLKGLGRFSKQAAFICGVVEVGTDKQPVGTLTFAAAGGTVLLADGAEMIVSILGNKSGLLASGGDISINADAGNGGVKLELAQVGGNIAAGKAFKILQAGGDITGAFANANVTSSDGQYEFEIEMRDANGSVIPSSAITSTTTSKTIWLRTVRSPALTATGAGVVPEPSTYALCGGLAALGFAFWRRRLRKK